MGSLYRWLLTIIDNYIDKLQVEIDSTDLKIERLAEDYKRRFDLDVIRLRKRQASLNQTLLNLRDRN